MSGYEHATAYTTSMAKRKNADDVLSQVKEMLKKHRAQLDQEEAEEKVETDTEDRETDEGGGGENEGGEAPTTQSYIQYSP